MRHVWVGDFFTLAVRVLFPPTTRATMGGGEQSGGIAWRESGGDSGERERW